MENSNDCFMSIIISFKIYSFYTDKMFRYLEELLVYWNHMKLLHK